MIIGERKVVDGFYGKVDVTEVREGSVVSYYDRTYANHYEGVVVEQAEDGLTVLVLAADKQPQTDSFRRVMFGKAYYANLTGIIEMPSSHR